MSDLTHQFCFRIMNMEKERLFFCNSIFILSYRRGWYSYVNILFCVPVNRARRRLAREQSGKMADHLEGLSSDDEETSTDTTNFNMERG